MAPPGETTIIRILSFGNSVSALQGKMLSFKGEKESKGQCKCLQKYNKKKSGNQWGK
jgi:hypothetical protein